MREIIWLEYLRLRSRFRRVAHRVKRWWHPMTDAEILAQDSSTLRGLDTVEWMYAKAREALDPDDHSEDPCPHCGRVILCGPHPCAEVPA